MIRLILFFVLIVVFALGFSWLSDLEGSITFENIGRNSQSDGFSFVLDPLKIVLLLLSVVGALLLSWSILKGFFTAPGNIARSVRTRRENKGITALNEGIIAVNAGDSKMAGKLAKKAGKSLVHQPMTALLKAQAAHLSGNPAAARRVYESMLESPDTEVMGLRGLYDEARKERELIAAKQFAQKALKINKNLGWAIKGLLELQSRAGEWHAARQTLKLARLDGYMKKAKVNRLRAILLSAEAIELEPHDADQALKYGLEAHKLAKDLVPAAEITGRILASKGNAGRAAKIVARTWEFTPHPDLAIIYAHSRTGDSFRDRIARLKTLNQRTKNSAEGSIAIAEVAIEGKDWNEARTALQPFLDKEPSERICTLMARIEGGEFGDKGRVREWLARAVNAPRDPVWVADGYVSDQWLAVSPITGQLDRFMWSVPQQSVNAPHKLSNDEFLAITASKIQDNHQKDYTKDDNQQGSTATALTHSEKIGKDAASEAVIVESKKGKPSKPGSKPKVTTDKSHLKKSNSKEKSPAKKITIAAKEKKTNRSEKFVSTKRAPDDPGTDKDSSKY